MPFNQNVAVVLRVYPGLSKPPPSGGVDKLDLFSRCFSSFVDAAGQWNVDLYLLLDGCPPDFEKIGKAVPPHWRLFVENLPSVGNNRTFERQLEIALEQPRGRVVLFLEDDYLWSPAGFESLVKRLQQVSNQGSITFATPYHHPDYYRIGFHRMSVANDVVGWQSGLTTTCTFGARSETIAQLEPVLRLYSTLNDFGMWLLITRQGLGVRSLGHLIFVNQRAPELVRDWLKAWLYILLGNLRSVPRAKLVFSSAGGASHMVAGEIGVGFEWLETD